MSFSRTDAFKAAVRNDAENLEAKTAQALFFAWQNIDKTLPTHNFYAKRDLTEAEMLPNMLAVYAMLKDLENETGDARAEAFNDRAQFFLQAIEMAGETPTHQLYNYVSCQCFEIIERIEEAKKEGKNQIVILDFVVQHQKEQVEEMADTFELIVFNPASLSPDQIFAQCFPMMHPFREAFEDKTRAVADFFDKHPNWKFAVGNTEDTTALEEILKHGVTKEVLEFMIRYRRVSPEADTVLSATQELLRLAERGEVPSSGAIAPHAVLETIVDGKNPLEIAISHGNFGLAALLKNELQRRGRG